MAFFPLDKKFNPDFAIPGKKPTGATKLDQTNKFVRGRAFYLPLVDPRTTTLKTYWQELPTGGLGTPVWPQSDLYKSSTPAPVYKNGWLQLNQSTNTGFYRSDAGVDSLGRSTGNYTWAIKVKNVNYVSQGSSVNSLMGYKGLTTAIVTNSSNQLAVYFGSSNNTYTEVDLGDGEEHTIVVSIGLTTVKVYHNGVKLVSEITTAPVSVSSTAVLGIGGDFEQTTRDLTCEVEWAGIWNYAFSPSEALELSRDTWQQLEPTTQTGYFTASAAGVTSALTGTATATITETDITDGGKTIIVTLTGDTFKAAGTGPIGSTADTQALIDGFDAASSPTNGWNNEVRDKALTSEVVRTSSTIATWTISAQAGYDISATETITGTIPTDVLVTGAGAITSTPTFTIDPVSGFQVAWARNSNTVIQVGM